MDINARLKELLEDRGWSEYRLAIRSGLSQSTIANIFRRNTVPSFSTLEAICAGLGITLSQFFSDDDSRYVELTPDLQALFEGWKELTIEQKEALLQLVDSINNN